jgi:hypothetical protein
MAEGIEPRHDSVQDHLDATTNLVGLPQNRGEVSSPTPFVLFTPCLPSNAHNVLPVARL